MNPRPHRPNRTLVLLTLAAAAGVAAFADGPPAQIAVSPSRLDLTLDARGSSHALTLMNLGDESIDVDLSMMDWTLDESNGVVPVDRGEQSLTSWIVANPMRFTVGAGRSQTVRFAIRPRVEPEPGEHRAMLYFNQRLPERADAPLKMRFRLGVAIYAQVGAASRWGTVHGVDVAAGAGERPALRFDLESRGTANVRMQGTWAIEPRPAQNLAASVGADASAAAESAGPRLAGALPSFPVLPGHRRTIELRASETLPPGPYRLIVEGRLGHEPFRRERHFRVAGAEPAAGLAADAGERPD